ncbi:MAG TPA: bacillithiol biosynthesis BshC, partial [Archangium sp.]
AAIDPTFAQGISRTDKTVRRGISRLVARYGRSITRRDQTTLERVERLRAYLAPGGAPQERIHGLPYYASRFGGRTFTRLVLEACVPFSGDLRDLTP